MSLHQMLVVLIIALPLAGFLTTAMVGRRLGLNAFWIPVGAVVASWLVAMYVIATFHSVVDGEEGALQVTLWTWIPAGTFDVEFGFLVDNLTAVLLTVVTTIGMLVHIYSIGYMRHDPGYWRFFAYLNL
ncbi:MAG: NADH-quinone oxidoreductase subunit L, partial [Chloroflexota bacterium]